MSDEYLKHYLEGLDGREARLGYLMNIISAGNRSRWTAELDPGSTSSAISFAYIALVCEEFEEARMDLERVIRAAAEKLLANLDINGD